MSNIVFKGHITSLDAMMGILRLGLVIVRNMCRSINGFVHRFPWVCIIVTIVIAIVVSFVQIGKARAERDKINKSMIQVQMKLDSYQATFARGYK